MRASERKREGFCCDISIKQSDSGRLHDLQMTYAQNSQNNRIAIFSVRVPSSRVYDTKIRSLILKFFLCCFVFFCVPWFCQGSEGGERERVDCKGRSLPMV